MIVFFTRLSLCIHVAIQSGLQSKLLKNAQFFCMVLFFEILLQNEFDVHHEMTDVRLERTVHYSNVHD